MVIRRKTPVIQNQSCCFRLMVVTALQHAILCSANAGRWVITACRVVCDACKHSCCGNIGSPTATEEERKHINCTKWGVVITLFSVF